MCFMIKDHELLEKYSKIQDKACSIIKKEFDNEPVYNDKYPKIKLKFPKEKKQILIKNQKKFLIVFVYQ